MKIWSTIKKDIYSLYVHIPFCEHICFYCDFAKVIKPKNDESINAYLDKVDNELSTYNNKFNSLKTIYIGGGTPSCLSNDQTTKLLEIINKHVDIKNIIEYSIELNPESVTLEKLKIYKNYGINRLSIGVQTFDNNLLQKIGRQHNNKKALEAIELARKAEFNNISIDLMYNLFNQTIDNIDVDLDYIKKIKPEHISWYSLIMKENSIWGKLKYNKPENDELFDEYVNKGLVKLGYKRYEISNYSKKEIYNSVHNLSYWKSDLFVGVGYGASGFEKIKDKYYLTQNVGNVSKYEKTFEIVEENDLYFQIIMMGLRMIKGIDISDGLNKQAYLHFKNQINKNIELGLLDLKDNYLFCTSRGFDVLNEILLTFL
ncbi:coproporphyrinogen III oxidase [Spiroplasma litorale]|uniref:Heme chaperone HemW n=1 Tax=Spiroplasma litorale TaxID=216942 RepID=A0A0K1W2J8_9MOLU|nr:radical SAM family heme chaperone HemW [Spiroplasma litorale]AKX34401.1 coproporphyrinogen III oxidase [Spiroplasma litorale]